jgi:hypothetical protein
LKISPRNGGKVLKNPIPEGGKVLKKPSGKGPYVLRTDTGEGARVAAMMLNEKFFHPGDSPAPATSQS